MTFDRGDTATNGIIKMSEVVDEHLFYNSTLNTAQESVLSVIKEAGSSVLRASLVTLYKL